MQNAAHNVVDPMNVETSFTDNPASHSNISSSGHPTTTLTFESECATNHYHRQLVDSSAGLSERLLVGRPAEFQVKTDFLATLCADHVESAVSAAQWSLELFVIL